MHRTFNVSIPRHHIPQDQWIFEYGPAENDPEFGEGRNWDAGDELKGITHREGEAEMNDPTGQKASGENQEAESSGRWVHHLTGSKLGDPDGYIGFTVIGYVLLFESVVTICVLLRCLAKRAIRRLTVANEMLSLQGSIQPDPFSPEHVPHPDKEPSSPAFPRDETSEVEARDEHSGEEEEESDEDGFKHLAKLTEEAKASQKAERAKEEAERFEKAKKRKRRESRDGVGEDGARHDKETKKKRIKESTV